MTSYRIEPDDLTSPDVLGLLQYHLDEVHGWSPTCKVHALPPERLREADIAFFAARDGQILAAVGALKELDGKRGEIKSMRAAPEYRGRGAGEAILRHLIAEARKRGYNWLGLETGRPDNFIPAKRLYRKYGFSECPAFAEYVSDEYSMCMEKHL
ncbi:GNAT family N-acetyltransferase [Erythrobacter ani]|uniref:GNAT family N-acetyltransferase n=1 Tax=Erythrobacter ani TaxID=2827235 RepID=A0ABS6SM04_9SPHN|nr:GNAT family N-acetyltransferase [Erythrobacter ani]MBV7266026.1 GNAT family N-acetyltransferase [Erythrobacter ani]